MARDYWDTLNRMCIIRADALAVVHHNQFLISILILFEIKKQERKAHRIKKQPCFILHDNTRLFFFELKSRSYLVDNHPCGFV